MSQDMNVVLFTGYKSWNMAAEARWFASNYCFIRPNSLYASCQRNIPSSFRWDIQIWQGTIARVLLHQVSWPI